MAPKIVVARHELTDVAVAQKMVPDGFEFAAIAPNTPEFRTAMKDAKFLVGYGGPILNEAFYRAAPNLKLVQLLSAGYDTCDIEAAGRARVPICNNGGANSIAVAEHTFALLLAVTRQVTWLHKMMSSGAWRGNEWLGRGYYELAGKTLGIVGLGTIGKKVARIAKGF